MSFTFARALIVIAASLFSTSISGEVLGPNMAWVQPTEYPSEAFMRRSEGKTTLALTYDESAVVKTCKVVRSSADRVLDEAGCRLVVGSRVGNAIDRLTLLWKNPTVPRRSLYGGATPIAPNWWLQREDFFRVPALIRGARGPVTVRFTVSADGRARDCVGESSGGAELAAATCQLLEQRAAFITAHDSAGPKSTTASQELIWAP